VPEDVKYEREAEFMRLQAEISTARLREKIGSLQEVLVDEAGEDGAVARSHADAPEIDGLVYLQGASGLRPGDMLRVRISGASEHDLYGEPA